MTDHDHTVDDIKKAVFNQLKTDYTLVNEREDVEMDVTAREQELDNDYIHVSVKFTIDVNLYRNTVPSYIQNFRMGDGVEHHISVVADAEELNLEG